MNDSDIANAYLDSLTAELDAAGLSPVPERPQGFGVSLQEYMDKTGCTEDIARRILACAVKAGILVKHQMRSGGKGNPSFIYCRPSEWPPR